MASTTCRVCLVSTVSAGCKSTPEKQAQNKASRPRGHSGLPNDCLCFVPATSALVLLKLMFRKLTCVEQSTFLDIYGFCIYHLKE